MRLFCTCAGRTLDHRRQALGAQRPVAELDVGGEAQEALHGDPG
jgi:hypothetical protein